jgi:hypothetical protein
MKRLWMCIGATLLIVLGGGMTAFAGNRPPSITPTLATFTVAPKNSAATIWTLNLWAHGKIVGTASGTAGTLTVTVPATSACKFQADVLRGGQWFSGTIAALSTCGGQPAATTTTTTTTTTSTTSTTMPVTSSKGGKKPKGGPKPSTDTTGFAKAATTSAVISGKSPTPVSSSQLAFTGVGTGLWTLVLVGSGLVVLGASLLVRRPRLHR